MSLYDEDDFQDFVKKVESEDNREGSCETTDIPDFISPEEFLDSINEENCADKLFELLNKYQILYNVWLQTDAERIDATDKCNELTIEKQNLEESLKKLNIKISLQDIKPKNPVTNKITLAWLMKHYPEHIHLIYYGNFYNARFESAIKMHEIFGYRVTYNAGYPFTGFPSGMLPGVVKKLQSLNVKYIVVNNGVIIDRND